jgi:hypothetical protein
MNPRDPSDWHHLTIGHINALPDVMPIVGEYIESIGKTDLAEYTEDEFKTLILVVCNAMSGNSGIPF